MPPHEAGNALCDDTRCDLAIVGAGYTGLAAARQWARHAPDDRIVVLESSEIGEGNPGRNSGFMLEISLANDADAQQVERMRRCNQLIAQTMEEMREIVEIAAIDCDLIRSGTYRAAAGNSGRRALDQYRAFLDAANLPYESLERGELERRIGSRFYHGGLYSPHCYLVQPAALIRGLARQLPRSVRIFEHTPVTRLTRQRDCWLLTTPQAEVRAVRVILANNAFSKGLGVGASRVVAMYTYAALTEPLPPEMLATLGSESSWGLLPAHRLGSTLRRTLDNRLLIRSFYGYEREADRQLIEGKLADNLSRRFPQLGQPDFAYVWSGATGFTYNGAPLWGQVGPDLYVSAGCNGGGVVKGTLFGRLLVDSVFGREIPDMQALFGSASWMPPEPLRRIGFHAIAALERRRGMAEV
ncbi:MAG: FAD-binding oxidoreductase [Gammaproteobacteria bacterium]|nr:FAD-binding oxidoreductase [Gammaproteobacteria bacterium]